MNVDRLRFTAESAAFTDPLLALSATRPLGTEIYTYCVLAPANHYGQLWAGVDDGDRLAAALLDNGHYRTLLLPGTAAVGDVAADTAQFFCGIPAADRFPVMGNPAPARQASPAVQSHSGKDLAKVLAFLRNRPLTPQDEAALVFRIRAVNAGLSDVFTLSDDAGRLCACAHIMAKNRRYALIGNVYTAPDCRGRGMAGTLLAACEARAAEEGLLPVLYCRKEMAPFYKARGYRRIRNHAL